MGKIVNSVFAMLLCTFFVVKHVRCDTHEYIAIEKALKSLTNVVVKYHKEFDTRVKFSQLQEAIDTIDEAMLDYQGTAKSKLDRLRTLNSDARSQYHECVGPVFEWCVSINSTLDIFIPYINDQYLTKHDRDIIWNMTVEAIGDGQDKTSVSLESLIFVQRKTNELKNLLDSMLHDMHDDFGPEGYYGKQTQELKNAIIDRQKALKTALIITAVGIFFTALATMVTGPVGLALGLLVVLPPAMAAVFHSNKRVTYEKQLQAIQALFNVLDEKIRDASEIANQINVDLDEDKINLHALAGLIDAANRNKRLLMTDNESLRVKLVTSLQNLGNKCYQYTKWHGYGSQSYPHRHARARRQATQTCKARRLGAITTMTESLPSNTTFETLASKVHSIIKEMDCESYYITLPTPPQNQKPALSIDETTNESLRSNMITNYLKHVQ